MYKITYITTVPACQVSYADFFPVTFYPFTASLSRKSVVGTPQVALELTTSTTPGLLRPIGDGNFTHVIMPMQHK